MNVRDQNLHSKHALSLYGEPAASRLLLGTAGYPSPAILTDAVKASGATVVTVSLRRETAGGRFGQRFLGIIKGLDVRVLPNTAGCRTAREAITTAEMARELFGTELGRSSRSSAMTTRCSPMSSGSSRPLGCWRATASKCFLTRPRIFLLPSDLQRAGCEVIMPWGAPIGSGRGLANLLR